MIYKILSFLLVFLPFVSVGQTVATSNKLGTSGVTSILSTTSSSYKLSVSGAIKQFGTGLNVVGSPTLFLQNTTASTGRQYGINSSNTGLFQIFDVNASNAVRLAIDKNGNLGLGTTAPTQKLHIAGSFQLDGILYYPKTVSGFQPIIQSIAANNNIQIGILGGGNFIVGGDGYNYSNGALTVTGLNGTPAFIVNQNDLSWPTIADFRVQGNTKMSIYSNGRVGIGTTIPTEQLEVAGRLKATGLVITTGAAAGKVLTSDANGVATWQAAAGGSSSSWTSSGTNLINADTGLVIIGGNVNPAPTDASLKLAIKGTTYTQKLRVTQTGWADYVFDTSYQLPGITEVATFIKINKRLPELPSAADVQKNGIDVGDNQVLLLKKIEELTLYLIKEHDEIQQLKEQNKQLQKAITNLATAQK